MSWLIAVPVFLTAWFLFVILGAGPKAIEDERNGMPEEDRHGVSIVPGFPVFPVIAWVLWWNASPFVADMIVWLDVALLVFSLAMIVYYQVELRRVHEQGINAKNRNGPNSA